MSILEVPIVVIVCGEGGSGGALGIAIGDRVLMQEYSVYSVIPPEGCAAILWRDAEPEGGGGRGAQDHRPGSAGARASSTRSCPEPPGGAHNDHDRATALVDQALTPGARRSCAAAGRRAARSRGTRSSDAWGRKGRRSSIARPHRPRRRRGARPGNEVAPLAAPAVRRRSGFGAGVGARAAPDRGAAAVHARLRRPRRSEPLPESVARSAPRSVQARRHGPRGRRASSRRSRARSASPSTATTTSTASHRPSSCDGPSSCSAARSSHFIPERLKDGYGLQPAAIDRLHAEGVSADRLGGLRHPRRRRRAAGPRARRRSDHHRPPRARRRRCRRRWR